MDLLERKNLLSNLFVCKHTENKFAPKRKFPQPRLQTNSHRHGNPMKFELILFDADGTLFDYDKAEVYALKNTFNSVQIPYQKEFIDEI